MSHPRSGYIVFGRDVASVVSGRCTEQLPTNRIAAFIERFNRHLVFRTDPAVAVAVEECLPSHLRVVRDSANARAVYRTEQRFRASTQTGIASSGTSSAVPSRGSRLISDSGTDISDFRWLPGRDIEVTATGFRDICEEICHFHETDVDADGSPSQR